MPMQLRGGSRNLRNDEGLWLESLAVNKFQYITYNRGTVIFARQINEELTQELTLGIENIVYQVERLKSGNYPYMEEEVCIHVTYLDAVNIIRQYKDQALDEDTFMDEIHQKFERTEELLREMHAALVRNNSIMPDVMDARMIGWLAKVYQLERDASLDSVRYE